MRLFREVTVPRGGKFRLRITIYFYDTDILKAEIMRIFVFNVCLSCVHLITQVQTLLRVKRDSFPTLGSERRKVFSRFHIP